MACVSVGEHPRRGNAALGYRLRLRNGKPRRSGAPRNPTSASALAAALAGLLGLLAGLLPAAVLLAGLLTALLLLTWLLTALLLTWLLLTRVLLTRILRVLAHGGLRMTPSRRPRRIAQHGSGMGAFEPRW